MEIAPGVHQLRGLACQVFALLDEEVTLIDTGAPGSAWLVLRQLRALGRSPSDVTRIVLTHYHIDHRGAAEALRQATGARVLIHATEAPYLRGAKPYPNPVRDAVRARLAGPILSLFRGSAVPAEEVEDGDLIEVTGGLRVHHVPGHTQGSIALSLPSQGLLFSGDAMGYRRRRLEEPEPRLTEDTVAARTSIERLARLDVDTICFSHFAPLRQHAQSELRTLVGSWAAAL